jgi:hypothetical protein
MGERGVEGRAGGFGGARRPSSPSSQVAGALIPSTRPSTRPVPTPAAAAKNARRSWVAALERSRAAALLARAAVASYFLHLVVEDVRAWAGTKDREDGRVIPFPALSVATVLPAALAVVAGVWVPAAASLLAVEMLWKSMRVLYIQM